MPYLKAFLWVCLVQFVLLVIAFIVFGEDLKTSLYFIGFISGSTWWIKLKQYGVF